MKVLQHKTEQPNELKDVRFKAKGGRNNHKPSCRVKNVVQA